MAKTYHGSLEETKRGGRIVEVVDDEGRIRPLSPRLDLWNHSPTGFMWGYGGSGPAQLALALAADALGDDQRAVRIHQRLKWDRIAKLDQDQPFTVTDLEIVDRILSLEALDRLDAARQLEPGDLR